ncbi:ImmA/IrrE family metallo-endopeptidase [Holdemanella porci]|uniref:ImmA/IrrE family metallo-endopeptidase n=1 Tax=Holdemanella porci TaxID=2652276 RepID=UPI0022E90F34|nr:ImmA/IrrE family metallo-endopeptidase [Holdemanella porci]
MIEAIKSASKIPIEFKNKSEDSNLANGAKGYYSPTTDQIVVNKDLEDIHTAKTLIHEYAQSILHKQTDKDRSQREIEAESLAFVICDHFGLDTSEYSFGYIARYANNDPKELKEILNNIQSAAHEMIEQLEPIYKEKSLPFSHRMIQVLALPLEKSK